MDDNPREFKVEYLYETLKFIKNDQQLIFKSPEWPITRVKFYHALIKQRQWNSGYGLNSLYGPLWEAMQIFSVKYTYRVSITNSTDEEKGFLVLEKIPIKSKEKDETDSEDDSTCTHQLSIKKRKLYIKNRNIIENIAPTLLEPTLKSLLDFVNDEASASIDINDLAPIEVHFIENVQEILNQKHLFYKLLSPVCISIMRKITSTFYMSSYNLKVTNVKIHPKTSKREVTLIKEPNFTSPAAKKNSKSNIKPSMKPLRSPKCLTTLTAPNKSDSKSNIKPSMKPLRSPKCLTTLTAPNKSDTKSICKKDGESSPIDIETIIDTESISAAETFSEKKAESVSTSPVLFTTSGEQNRITVVSEKVTDKIPNSPSRSAKIPESPSRSAKIPESPSRSAKIPESPSRSAKIPESPSRSAKIPESPSRSAKIPESPSRSAKIKLPKGREKRVMLEGLLKPVESAKGLRMMKLMGWDGGALGLRGEGITEPLMPVLDLKPKAGLGHEKKDPKLCKMSVPPSTVNSKGNILKKKEEKPSLMDDAIVIEPYNKHMPLWGRQRQLEFREQIFRCISEFVQGDDMEIQFDLTWGYSRKIYCTIIRIFYDVNNNTRKVNENERQIVAELRGHLLKGTYLMANLRERIIEVWKTFNYNETIQIKNRIKKQKDIDTNDDSDQSNTNAKEDYKVKNKISAQNTDTGKSNGKSVKIETKDVTVCKDVFCDDKNHITPKNEDKIINNNAKEDKKKESSNSKAGQENTSDLDVIEYKEYNIIKISSRDLDSLEKLSSNIQGHIINDENYSKNNYLKCHGIQNGGLIYSSEGNWFNDILYTNFNINSSNGTIVTFKMKVFVNSFLKVKEVLNTLEVCNVGLTTNNWIVLEEGNCYFVVDLNIDSFKFISKKRFVLFAGIDTALFTVIL